MSDAPSPVLVNCASCGACYDVSARTPGKRVRCRRCGVALVVPERKPEAPSRAAARTASERIRRAAGPLCDRHPRAVSVMACERCGRQACEACHAPAPHGHLCTDCAGRAFASPLLPIDYGLTATPLIALRAWARALGWRIVLWNVLVHASVVALFVVAMTPLFWLMERARAVEDAPLRDVYVSLVRSAGIVVTLGSVTLLEVLLAGGNAVFMDGALRGARVPLGTALVRALHRAPAIAATWAILLLALLVPFFAIELPCVALAGVLADRNVIWIGLLAFAPIALVVTAAFILAGPIAVLEERGAASAVARALRLARPHLASLSVLILAFGAIAALVFGGTTVLLADTGLAGSAASFAITLLVNLGWPALLVAAYHGLAAEAADVVGRR